MVSLARISLALEITVMFARGKNIPLCSPHNHTILCNRFQEAFFWPRRWLFIIVPNDRVQSWRGGALKTIIVKLKYADCHSRERLFERPARRKDLWCLKRHALKSNGLCLWIENTFVEQAVLV